jgi:hypothetical protein
MVSTHVNPFSCLFYLRGNSNGILEWLVVEHELLLRFVVCEGGCFKRLHGRRLPERITQIGNFIYLEGFRGYRLVLSFLALSAISAKPAREVESMVVIDQARARGSGVRSQLVMGACSDMSLISLMYDRGIFVYFFSSKVFTLRASEFYLPIFLTFGYCARSR